MNHAKYREIFTCPNTGVIAKIRRHLAHFKNTGITVQHDGAKPHMGLGTEHVLQAAMQHGGWTMTLVRQPAQCPILNVCDLGFFCGWKTMSFSIKGNGQDIDAIVDRGTRAWNAYPWQRIATVWGALHTVYRNVLLANGDNMLNNVSVVKHSNVRNRGAANGQYIDYNS